MAITQTPRLKLQKQASGDANWHTGLNDGLDNADLRLVTTGAGSPVGAAEGFFVGAFYIQTSPVRLWICTAIGTPGTWVDVIASGGDILAALVLANTIALQGKESGGTARNLAVMSAANKVLLGALTNLLTLQTNGATALKVDYGAGEQTVWHAGNDGPGSGQDADTVDGIQGANILNYAAGSFFEEVAVQQPDPSSNKSVNHLLGAVPRLYEVRARCTAIDSGWAIGDELLLAGPGHTTFPSQIATYCNSTALGIIIGPGGIAAAHKTAFSIFTLTAASWRLIFRAWK